MQEKEDSIGSAGSLANRSERSQEKVEELWEDEEEELSGETLDRLACSGLTSDNYWTDADSMSGADYTSLAMFLAATGLHDWTQRFVREKIDLETLMLLTEADLADSMKMPLGTRYFVKKYLIELSLQSMLCLGRS